MSYVAKLLHGAKELNLNAGRYELGQDFAPLPINLAPRSGNDSRKLPLDSAERANRRWTFGMNINGASDTEIDRALEDVQYFLNLSIADDVPVFLGFKANADITSEPKYGQRGALRRYEIVEGRIVPPSNYGVADLRKKRLINCRVELVVKPIAEGRQQRVCQGAGGLLIDNMFTADGRSRGVIVSPARTNEVSNPIFGHATYNTNWTDGADLIDAQNTDLKFVLFGHNSAKLTAIGASTNTYTILVTAANTNTHAFSFYAKLPSEGAVTSSQVTMDYAGSGLTEAYQDVGNGWYRVTATAAGVASAQNFRIIVANGNVVYVDGVQMEEGAYPSALCHGDMLGCAWAGTAHASDTSRTACELSLDFDRVWEVGGGTIHMSTLMNMDSGDIDGDIVFFRDSVANRDLHYDNANNRFEFTDGTTTIGTGTQTWSAGDILHLTVTWGPANGIILYQNGVALHNNGTYTPLAVANTLNIGSTVTPTLQLNGTVLGVTSYAKEFTAAEVLAFYNNVVQLTNDNSPVDALPWEWTDDGDSTVEGCIESGSSIITVFGGVPGSGRAKTRALVEFTSDTNGEGPFLSVIPMREYIDIEDVLFHDIQGTSTSSADCGAEVDRSVWGTTVTTTRYTATVTTVDLIRVLNGADTYALIRIPTKAGSDDLLVHWSFFWSGAELSSDRREISAVGNYVIGTVPFYRPRDLFVEPGLASSMSASGIRIKGGYLGASTGNVDLDFILLSPSPILKMTVGTTGEDYFIIEGQRVFETTSNTHTILSDDVTDVEGDPNGIDLFPESYNVVCVVPSYTIASDWTWSEVYVTPRYALT